MIKKHIHALHIFVSNNYKDHLSLLVFIFCLIFYPLYNIFLKLNYIFIILQPTIF